MTVKKKNTWTKERQSAYYKEWRAKNKEKLAKYNKKWHEENIEHIQQYLKNNSDHIKMIQKDYRDNHKEEISKMWKDWYKEHPERSPKRRFTESKNKAIKRRGILWSLSFEEYSQLIELPCHYCNNNLGSPVKRSCGLDRLDSSRGYEAGNVVSCCFICNTIKNEHLTQEETKAAVKAILAVRGIIFEQNLPDTNI